MRLILLNLLKKQMSDNKPNVRVGCGALIINDKGEALLLKRDVKSRDEYGYWSQPGGGVEFGETIKEAIVREIKEEVGVEIELIKFLSYTDQNYLSKNEHWVSISYLAKIISGEPTNMEPEKHAQMKWFSLSDLPKKLSRTTEESVRAYLESSF